MKIEVLTHAKEDLFDGYLFYERQESGIGDYFLDSLSATSNRYSFIMVIIGSFSVFTG